MPWARRPATGHDGEHQEGGARDRCHRRPHDGREPAIRRGPAEPSMMPAAAPSPSPARALPEGRSPGAGPGGHRPHRAAGRLHRSGEPGGDGRRDCCLVLAGQLTIGWGNDLLDAAPRSTGRAAGQASRHRRGVPDASVLRAWLLAGAACVALSLLAGWRSGLVPTWRRRWRSATLQPGDQGVLVVLGALCGRVRHLAGRGSRLPTTFPTRPRLDDRHGRLTRGGAHFLNTLPDLVADAVTGMQGLPHRLGATATRDLAASPAGRGRGAGGARYRRSPGQVGRAPMAAAAVLAAVALVGRGQVPFQAAIASRWSTSC